MMKKGNIYSEKQIIELINPRGVQLYFLYSPLPFPTVFASHCWIVTNEYGKLDRWEVWQSAGQSKTSKGHVHQNLFPPFQALHKNFFVRSLGRQKPRLIEVIQNYDLAVRMIRFMKQEAMEFPYWNKYIYYPGPNSNTYVQWIIDRFPECKVALPKSAIGKKFKVSK